MNRFIAWLLRRKIAPVEEEARPNRQTRRLMARDRSGEFDQKRLEGELRKAKRKRARGYKAAHVRTRQIYNAGVKKGMDMAVGVMLKTIKEKTQRKTWTSRVAARLRAA